MLTIEEIKQFLAEDSADLMKRKAEIGLRYYEGEHDIRDFRMFYYNADGVLTEDKTRSNVKISHPFFTELVDQEVQYMLSNEDGFIHSDIPELQTKLDEYFDDEFVSELQEVLTDTVSCGWSYMYTYTGQDDRLHFSFAECMGVREIREKETDDHCSYVLRWYIDRIAKTNTPVKKIEIWDNKQVTFYVQDPVSGEILLDKSEPINPRPHVVYRKSGDDRVYYEEFGFIPFFRLDNNRKRFSGVKPIKDLIDDYDMMSCGLSNNLTDFDYPIYLVKGFQGDNLDELQKNLRTKKTIGVDDTGGLEVHTVEIPYQARQAKMEADEKNIYRFGMGFNSAQLGDGNITNVVIKSRYALLDLKCNKLTVKLKGFLKQILRVVINEINAKEGTVYDIHDVYFDFKREVITNASDNATIEKTDAEKKQVEVNILLGLQGVLDNETIIQMICEVLDINYEDIKDKLPDPDENQTDLEEAQTDLGQVIPDNEEL